MSGGSWDYFSYKLEEVADKMLDQAEPIRRVFARHLKLCADALHAIEWEDSGDTGEGSSKDAIYAVFGDQSAGCAAMRPTEEEVAEIRAAVAKLRDQLTEILREQ